MKKHAAMFLPAALLPTGTVINELKLYSLITGSEGEMHQRLVIRPQTKVYTNLDKMVYFRLDNLQKAGWMKVTKLL